MPIAYSHPSFSTIIKAPSAQAKYTMESICVIKQYFKAVQNSTMSF